MKIKINMQADKPTVNNRIYPKQVLHYALQMAISSERGLPIVAEQEDISIDLSKILGFSKKAIITEDGSIYVEFDLLDTPLAQNFKDWQEWTLNGIGLVNENNEIDDYRITSVTPIIE